MTYGEVAEAAGHAGCARQVVWALNQRATNVPWHRVVGAGLKIRLTGEPGLEQRLRLETEGWTVSSGGALKKKLDAKLKPARLAGRKNGAKAR
jgi:alkylated DNA nucleotide flippase Atl1